MDSSDRKNVVWSRMKISLLRGHDGNPIYSVIHVEDVTERNCAAEEDDFACRLLLQTFVSRYGECHVAVNDKEAVEAYRLGLESGACYDLICMDIMMPVMGGREAVGQIRDLEDTHGIRSSDGAKIIMTTTVQEIKEVFRCFRELSAADLLKPIDLYQLLAKMRSYQLIQ